MSNPTTDREAILTFGKFKGFNIDEIMNEQPSYLVWLHHNTDFELSPDLLDEAEENKFDREQRDFLERSINS